MKTYADLTATQLVQLGRLDEAVERQLERRRAAREAGEQIDSTVHSLNALRRRLQRAVDDKERELEELQQEIERALDGRSGLEWVPEWLFGADNGSAEVGESLTLIRALRGQVVEQAVVLLLRSTNDDRHDP